MTEAEHLRIQLALSRYALTGLEFVKAGEELSDAFLASNEPQHRQKGLFLKSATEQNRTAVSELIDRLLEGSTSHENGEREG